MNAENKSLSAPLLRPLSWTGLTFAVIHSAVFVALYVDYLRTAGHWFADLPLVIGSTPFIETMRLLNGGDYDFSGDMTARVLAAASYGAALTYIAGWLIGTGARALARLAKRARSRSH